MADRPSARDEDRLPWLEPSGEGDGKRVRRPGLRTALVGLLVAYLGIGLALAFSLGYRFSKPAAEAPAEPPAATLTNSATVRVAARPAVPPEPVPPAEVLPKSDAVRVAAAPAPSVVAGPAETVAPKAIEPAIARAKTAVTPRANAAAKKIRMAARTSPKTQPPSRWQPMRSTPRGRVVQLGAYSTTDQADRAWRKLVRRYPYLGTRHKAVTPTPPIGGWRYHRLRLGTETQAQSLVICQYLQARGQSCIVIY